MPTTNNIKPTSPPVSHLSFTVTSGDTPTTPPYRNEMSPPSYDEFMAISKQTKTFRGPRPIDPPPPYSPFCFTDILIPPSYHFRHNFFAHKNPVSNTEKTAGNITRPR